jgi:hypothetical protein
VVWSWDTSKDREIGLLPDQLAPKVQRDGQGVIVMTAGFFPTLIGLPGVFVAILIGVTVAEPKLLTYAVLPFGVIAIQIGETPTSIGSPGLLVAVVIGVTVPEPMLAT